MERLRKHIPLILSLVLVVSGLAFAAQQFDQIVLRGPGNSKPGLINKAPTRLQSTSTTALTVGSADDKFIVSGATGNTTVAGTLGVTGNITGSGIANFSNMKIAVGAITGATATLGATDTGKVWLVTYASGTATVTLPAVGAGNANVWYIIMQTKDQTLTITTAAGDNIEVGGNVLSSGDARNSDSAADTVDFNIANKKIGAGALVVYDGAAGAWLVIPLNANYTTTT